MNEPNPVGRPTDYKPSYVEDVFKLSLLGATDKEVADFFDVSESTINKWKLDYPKFSESMRSGKLKADTEVAKKLYDKANGAEWIEDFATKCKTITYENGKKVLETEEIQVTPVRKAAPPDTQAISLWLRNRQGAKWRDKIDHELTGKDGGPVDITDKTAVTEAARAIAFLFANADR